MIGRASERHILGLGSLPAAVRGGVLAIGNFDGVHIGHQRILATARALADGQVLPAVVMTFEPPPERVLRPFSASPRITPADRKLELLLEAGADTVVTAWSDQGLLSLSAQDFIEQVIAGAFAARHVVEGDNFRFGRGRAGDVSVLARAAARFGFVTHVVDPVFVELPGGAERVSSSLIRRLVTAGQVEPAQACLGRPFALFERIVPGQGLGRTIEFPTANINPADQVIPADGVYAGRARVNGDGYPAAISVGGKPTLGGGPRVVEAFLVGAHGNLYGSLLRLEFLQRLRDQQRFDDTQQLKAQIAKDVERVRQICG
jgi:riboflavin kinase/FMN adenylyltransferase